MNNRKSLDPQSREPIRYMTESIVRQIAFGDVSIEEGARQLSAFAAELNENERAGHSESDS